MTVLFTCCFVTRQQRTPNRFRKKYGQSKITLCLAILVEVTRDANSDKITNLANATASNYRSIGMSVKSTLNHPLPPPPPYVDLKLIPRVDSESNI